MSSKTRKKDLGKRTHRNLKRCDTHNASEMKPATKFTPASCRTREGAHGTASLGARLLAKDFLRGRGGCPQPQRLDLSVGTRAATPPRLEIDCPRFGNC